MVAFWFVVGAALFGALLYLPFFLWFRLSGRGRRTIASSPRMTPAASRRNLIVAGVWVGGLCWYATEHGPEFGAMMHDAVLLKIWLAMSVWSAAMTAYTRAPEGATTPEAPAPEATPAPLSEGSMPAGFFRAATFGQTPVLVHRGFLLSGVVIAVLGSDDVTAMLVYAVAYAALFALHEAAHALAARRLGLRVYAILLVGQGGQCVAQIPRSVRDTFQVYAAGVAAQLVLLAATLAAVALYGRPDTPAGAALVMTFTWVNAMLVVVNLIPRVTAQGLRTDGAILLQLYRHVRRGDAHPLAAQHAASPVFAPSTRLLTIEGMKPDGFVAGIELLNDDTSPMEFVVEMLERFGGLDREAALQAMLAIHRNGGLLLPFPNRAIAELAAASIAREAQARGHALVCRAVSAAD